MTQLKIRTAICVGIFISASLCLVLLRYSSNDEEVHHIQKRFQEVEPPPPDAFFKEEEPPIEFDEKLPPDAREISEEEGNASSPDVSSSENGESVPPDSSENGGGGNQAGQLVCMPPSTKRPITTTRSKTTTLPPTTTTLAPRPTLEIIDTETDPPAVVVKPPPEVEGGGKMEPIIPNTSKPPPSIIGGGNGEDGDATPGSLSIGAPQPVSNEKSESSSPSTTTTTTTSTINIVVATDETEIGGERNKKPPPTDPPEPPIKGPEVERPNNKIPLVDGWNKEGEFIGCCPPGEANGVAYRSGFACCYGQVYNVTKEFCCQRRERVLDLNLRMQKFCYPTDGVLYCLMSDLNREELSKSGISTQCTNMKGKNKNPTECTFVCPPGFQIRGDKLVKCGSNGNWNEADPQACEGCRSSFTRDIWVLLDINESIGTGNLAAVRTFLKGIFSYLPISQDRVRVAVTAFNEVIFTIQNTWFLTRHKNYASLSRGINHLPSEGFGRNTREALTWLVNNINNTFNGENENRRNVDDIVILITTGPPDDGSLAGPAEVLREHSRLIVVSVGQEAASYNFSSLVSPPKNQNYLRVASFSDLPAQHDYLYDLLCEEYYIMPPEEQE